MELATLVPFEYNDSQGYFDAQSRSRNAREDSWKSHQHFDAVLKPAGTGISCPIPAHEDGHEGAAVGGCKPDLALG